MRVWLLLVLCLAGSATAAPTEEEEVFVEELLTEEPVVEVSQEQPDEFLQPEFEAKCIYKIKRQESGRFNQEPEVGANPVQIEVGEFDEAIEIVEDDVVENACLDYHCKKGKVCELDESNTPMCVCQDPTSCPPAEGEFEHVCGTDNKTYDTSCHFFATKCALEGTKKGHKLHLDYVGPCKFIEPCVDAELLEFPLRMRDWLKNVLVTLYERDMDNNLLTEKQKLRVKKIYENEKRLQAGEHSLDLLAHDFKKNYNMYIFPVHWQFGQLDQHPADGYLTHSELSPLRAPLIPMEHCTTRFFEECDADSDNYIALEEWAACFGVKEQDIDKELII